MVSICCFTFLFLILHNTTTVFVAENEKLEERLEVVKNQDKLLQTRNSFSLEIGGEYYERESLLENKDSLEGRIENATPEMLSKSRLKNLNEEESVDSTSSPRPTDVAKQPFEKKDESSANYSSTEDALVDDKLVREHSSNRGSSRSRNSSSKKDKYREPFLSESELEEFYLQPIDVGVQITYDNWPHDDGYKCARDCKKFPEERLCYFRFIVEQRYTMSPDCKKCPSDVRDCDIPTCLVADGMKKTVYTVNRMLPGTAMHVCEGDRLVVDVYNQMPNRSVSFHWNGLRQLSSPWMDGEQSVTQCTINPNQAFRYNFVADQVGTFYYRAQGLLQLDGLVGTLIIRSKYTETDLDKTPIYDFDHFSHSVLIQDWMHDSTDQKYPGYFKQSDMISLKPDSYLINGRGSFKDPKNRNRSTKTPMAEFIVKKGHTYLFRIIAATSIQCTFKLTIQNHAMKIIAIDGYRIMPVTVRTVHMHAGMRLDVVVAAKESKNAYWLRVQGNDSCSNAYQSAILKYIGASNGVPTSKSNEYLFYKYKSVPLPDFNNLRPISEIQENISMKNIKMLKPEERVVKAPNRIFNINSASYKFGVLELFQSNSYHQFYVPQYPDDPTKNDPQKPDASAMAEMFNQFLLQLPSFPLLIQNYQLSKSQLCPKRCDKMFCECLHLLKVSKDEVVQIVITDDMNQFRMRPPAEFEAPVDRPFHLHGHSLQLLQQGGSKDMASFTQNSIDKLKTYSEGILLDTFVVPSKGFAVVQFVASNPGYWTFHCQLPHVQMLGMSVVFQVGETNEFPKLPTDFPQCKDYLPPVELINDISDYYEF